MAEQIAIITKQRYETDIDACIVSLDSFCDNVMRILYRRQGVAMPVYGNALGGGAPGWLRAKAALRDGFQRLHDLRIRSLTAHPHARNKRLKHSQFYRIRQQLVSAFDQLEAEFPP